MHLSKKLFILPQRMAVTAIGLFRQVSTTTNLLTKVDEILVTFFAILKNVSLK